MRRLITWIYANLFGLCIRSHTYHIADLEQILSNLINTRDAIDREISSTTRQLLDAQAAKAELKRLLDLSNLVDRSVTADVLIDELDRLAPRGGRGVPAVVSRDPARSAHRRAGRPHRTAPPRPRASDGLGRPLRLRRGPHACRLQPERVGRRGVAGCLVSDRGDTCPG